METPMDVSLRTPPHITGVPEVRCSRCGRRARSHVDWVRGERNAVLCTACYQELLLPNPKCGPMEVIDS